MRSLLVQARHDGLLTTFYRAARFAFILILRSSLPLDSNDIDNYSQKTLSRFVRIAS
ncbi:hypothetical protein EDC54_10443 [Samsonia erythrinae]|uniref:Uncharacterized protein n=1 Tax=Samsonia erythrinae TaxID=160434 RepID=A0A4R3VJP0_9GAMM|nr:hypothetical protein EDC54_10443 [Samsonia erythrinae]